MVGDAVGVVAENHFRPSLLGRDDLVDRLWCGHRRHLVSSPRSRVPMATSRPLGTPPPPTIPYGNVAERADNWSPSGTNSAFIGPPTNSETIPSVITISVPVAVAQRSFRFTWVHRATAW